MQRMYDYQCQNRMCRDDRMYRPIKNAVRGASCKCEIEPMTALPECPVVAMAYIPFQTDNDVYDACTALQVGTIFPVLNKPFLGGCCR